MSGDFAEQLKQKIDEGRKKIADTVLESFKAQCSEAAGIGAQAASLEMPHPVGDAWKLASDAKGKSVNALTELLLEKVQLLGLSDVIVRVEDTMIACSGGWSGTPTAGGPEFAEQLNEAVMNRRQGNEQRRREICDAALDGFKTACLARAEVGISSARYEGTFEQDAWKWATATDPTCDGAAELKKSLVAQVETLAVPGARVVVLAGGKTLSRRRPKPPDVSACTQTIQSEGGETTCLDRERPQEQCCLWCQYKGFPIEYHLEISYDDDREPSSLPPPAGAANGAPSEAGADGAADEGTVNAAAVAAAAPAESTAVETLNSTVAHAPSDALGSAGSHRIP